MRFYEYFKPDSLYYQKPSSTHSCSTATFRSEDGNIYMGRNFDWSHDPGLIVRVHRRGKPVSVGVLDLYYLNLNRQKLRSLSLFDRLPLLFAPYIIEDGMNEHGVAVSGMMASASVAPYDPDKPSLINPVAKRLVLDYAKNTGEAVALLKRYNLNVLPEFQTHFMISDSNGHSVVVEFVEGEMKVIPATRRWQLCTNHLLWGRSESENDNRCDRYLRGSNQLEEMQTKTNLDSMLKMMSSISVEDWTMWTSVYNLTTGELRVAYRRNYKVLYVDRLNLR
jgi:penicillin V acylase-like amidase (Ntn superfamily)